MEEMSDVLSMAILTLYDEARRQKQKGPTQADVAKQIGAAVDKTRKLIAALKEEGLLAGEGLLYITPKGVQVLPRSEGAAEPEPPVVHEEDLFAPQAQVDDAGEDSGEPGPVAEDAAQADEAATFDGNDPAPATTANDQPATTGGSLVVAQPGIAVRALHRSEQRELRLSSRLAVDLGVDVEQVFDVIRHNIISVPKGDAPATNGEVFHVMSVMDRYKLDPFVRQIYAFRHKGKLCVMVGYDGWVSMAHRTPGFQGVTYEYPKGVDALVKSADGKAESWPLVIATAQSSDRLPTTRPCFFREWYVPQAQTPGCWQKQPTHRHLQKAFTMVVREHCGIVGLMDETDVEMLRWQERNERDLATPTQEKMNRLSETMRIENGGGAGE